MTQNEIGEPIPEEYVTPVQKGRNTKFRKAPTNRKMRRTRAAQLGVFKVEKLDMRSTCGYVAPRKRSMRAL
jgi:hypothetical protein